MKIVHLTLARADVFHIDVVPCVDTLKRLWHLRLSHLEIEWIGWLDIVRCVRRSPAHISGLDKPVLQENSFSPALHRRHMVMQQRHERSSVDEVQSNYSPQLAIWQPLE